MTGKTLMVQGTASHVGKSLVVTALCRLLKNRGYKVAPFKAQNMANNSYATLEEGEIGRAQAVQAEACGLEPSVLMNPVLLKPTSDRKSQVIVMGKAVEILSALEYQRYKKKLMPVVENSLRALMDSYEVVIIEGAGSPAEINLKKDDLVNMAVAKMVSSPVVLVGDIDKGGVFAQLVGTYELLDSFEKKLVKGFIVNKFRGEKKILKPGLSWIENRTGKRILGVLPYIQDHSIAEEDSVILQEKDASKWVSPKKLLVHVIRLPRISNFTDFEALSREKDVLVQYVQEPNRHCTPDLIIIPGSKNTMADLKFLWKSGFADHLQRCVKAGIPILGICGGYQMLGERILDPQKVESNQKECKGLGFLPTVTIYRKEKTTAQVKAIHLKSRLEIEGYEIHMGCTQGRNGHVPLFKITERHGLPIEDYDGMALNESTGAPIGHGEGSSILGTYIHGLFDRAEFRRYFLNQIRKRSGLMPLSLNGNSFQPSSMTPYDRLAKIAEKNMDMELLEAILDHSLTGQKAK